MTEVGVRSIPELRQFGSNLNQASAALATLFQQLNAQMHSAMEGWNDNQARSFAGDFERSKAQIDKMSQEMQKFSTYINNYCAKLDEVHNIHM